MSNEGPYYTVTHWRDFQHYRDRNPPWIKLHFSLLSSRDWVMLDDASRVLAIACMLIASRNDGRVPADPDYVKRVAYLHKRPDFNPLIECGFLVDASGCKQMLADARPEERQRRGETETEQRRTSAPRDSKGHRLPDDWTLPDDWQAWALTDQPTWTDEHCQRVAASFADYWRSKPGVGGRKTDWLATWRNWCRREGPLKGGAPRIANWRDDPRFAGAI